MKTATNYSKTTATLAKKLDKMLLEIEEVRHGVGAENLSPEEAQHVAAVHRALIDARAKATAALPWSEARYVAEQRASAQARHAAMMG